MARKKMDRWRHLRSRIKKCWYCKTDLVFYPLKKGETTPPNYATIEHLNSKLQFPNGRPDVYGKQRTLVVACYKCNNERGDREQKALPLEELQRRSGSLPKEETCQRCISTNPIWFAPNDLWNKVMRHPDGREASEKYSFICPNCFIEEAELLDIEAIWRLDAEHVSNLTKLPDERTASQRASTPGAAQEEE